MDVIGSCNEDNLLRMQKEMNDLKHRENELAKKIAQANQRQKSTSRDSLDSKDVGKYRSGSANSRKSSEGSPVRDHFQGRTIESKVAKYIRGEGPFGRKTSDVDVKYQSSNGRAASPTRTSRVSRSASNLDNNRTTFRQDTPRERSWRDDRAPLHKSSPNLSTVHDREGEEGEVLSDDEGTLRSRSKRGAPGGRYASTGKLNDADIPENELQDSLRPKTSRSEISLEIRPHRGNIDTSKRITNQRMIDDSSDSKNTHRWLDGHDSSQSPTNNISEQEIDTSQEVVSGSTIDIDSIVWSGNNTRDEEEVESENEEKPKQVTWSPDDIVVHDERHADGEREINNEGTGILFTKLKSDNRSPSFGNVRKISNDEGDFDRDSHEETSARELILDAKTKIDLEIQELERREEELRKAREEDLKRLEASAQSNIADEEAEVDEFFEAEETLSSDTKGLIEREIEESQRRELEHQQRQKMLYGNFDVPEESENEPERERSSEEEDDEETESEDEGNRQEFQKITYNENPVKIDVREKIEQEMQESIQREVEYQNRHTPMPEEHPTDDEEVTLSSEEDLEEKSKTEAVAKIEREIEEAKQREDELRRMRLELGAERSKEEQQAVEISTTDMADHLEVDPLKKIEMEIEEDRQRELELKRRYGLEVEVEDLNGIQEDDESSIEAEEVEIEQENLDVKEEMEEHQIAAKNVPGKVKIPTAFQIASISRPRSQSDLEKNNDSKANNQKIQLKSGNPSEVRNEQDTPDYSSEEEESDTEGHIEQSQSYQTINQPSESESEESYNDEPEGIAKSGEYLNGTPKIEDPDLASLKSGFTKERITLFDPNWKKEKSKTKRNRISKAREKYEAETPSQDRKSESKISPSKKRQYQSKSDILPPERSIMKKEEGRKVGPTAEIITYQESESKQSDFIKKSKKKLVLKTKASLKASDEKSMQPQNKMKARNCDDALQNGESQINSQKQKAVYQKKVEISGEESSHKKNPTQASRAGRKLDDDRSKSNVGGKSKVTDGAKEKQQSDNEMIADGPTLKKDRKAEIDRQKEKRKSLAELWERNALMKTEEKDGRPDMGHESVKKPEVKLVSQPKKSETSKKKRTLKSSAQLRVQQWEKMIASKGHVQAI